MSIFFDTIYMNKIRQNICVYDYTVWLDEVSIHMGIYLWEKVSAKLRLEYILTVRRGKLLLSLNYCWLPLGNELQCIWRLKRILQWQDLLQYGIWLKRSWRKSLILTLTLEQRENFLHTRTHNTKWGENWTRVSFHSSRVSFFNLFTYKIIYFTKREIFIINEHKMVFF
mgnify:CR=1 FL=1